MSWTIRGAGTISGQRVFAGTALNGREASQTLTCGRLPRPGHCLLTFLALVFVIAGPPSNAQTSSAESRTIVDDWVHQRDEQTGILVQTKELVLHPQAEPNPALKHRLIPNAFDALPGNAAIYYLKASGFLEQGPARDRISQIHKDAMARASKEGTDYAKVPPHVWLTTPPDALPRDEVKAYLSLTLFQPPFLREAARRAQFDMDRNFREVDDPIAYLLPEIQNLRSLARTQSMRCRLAIAEERIDDALEITGQQFALARHLGQDDFLVSNLVGIAIATIACNDALHLVQHAETPNLYWALAAMPSPLVDLRRSMAVERQFLYQQLKVLREVDETPRSTGYWRDFIDRLLPQLGMLSAEFEMPSAIVDPEAARAAIVAYVAAAYPGAKRYLIDRQKLPRSQVEAYPTAQVVFLAMVRFHNYWRDEVFKWTHAPFWQTRSKTAAGDVGQRLREDAERFGWFTLPTRTLLPAVLAVRTAEARCDQNIALLQSVEAVRMYAAAHDRKLPPSLDELSVPTPIEPFTGKPIEYELIGDRAVLSGHALPGMRYRLVL